MTQSSVYLARFAGDKVGDENEIPVSAILLPDFSGMSDTEKANAPVVNLSIKDIDMSTALAKKSKARQDIVITNTGRSPLQISKLQVFHPAVGAGLKKSVLKPGESTRLRVTVVKRNIGKKRRHLRLLMITNDPMQVYLKKQDDAEGPGKTLRAFKRVRIPAGKSVEVAFDLNGKELEWWDAQSNTMRVCAGRYDVMVGKSSQDRDLQRGSFVIE